MRRIITCDKLIRRTFTHALSFIHEFVCDKTSRNNTLHPRYMVTQIRAASAADHLLCVRSLVKIALIRDKKIEELIKSNYIIYV